VAKVSAARKEEALRVALALRAQGDFEGAIDLVREAVGEDLTDLTLIVTLAKLLSEHGQIARAERWFKRAIDLDPEDLEVRVAHATFLGQSGQLEACRVAFSRICQDLAAELKVPGTLEDDERVDQIASALAVSGVNLANCALLSGNFEGAVRFASSWLTHDEHWEAAHDILATAVERSELDARELAERGLASGELSPLMWLFLAEDALEQGDLARLLSLLERGNGLYAFDWQHAAPELDRLFAQADVAFRRALMREAIDEDTLAAWLAHRSR